MLNSHDSTPQRRLNATEVCCALILALNLTWCSLEGHADGFAASAGAVESIINSRAFWLSGVCAAGVLFVAAPGWTLHHDRMFQAVVPGLGTLGTLSFAIAAMQGFIDPVILVATGLVLSGFCHYWTTSRVILLEARTTGYLNIVATLVMAIVFKTVLLLVLPAVLPPPAQVLLAAAIPIANVVLFEVGRHAATLRMEAAGLESSRTVFGVPTLPRGATPSARSKHDSVLLIVLGAFLLATVRRLSFWGLWGTYATFPMSVIGGVPELVLVPIVLGLFAWLALVKTRSMSMTFRFQPAVVFIVAWLFLAAADLPSGFADVETALIHADEACAYVFFYSVVALSLNLQRMRSMRLLGLGGIAFGSFSLLWVALSNLVDEVGGAFITMVAYAAIVMAMVFTYAEAQHAGSGSADPVEPTPMADDTVDRDVSDAERELPAPSDSAPTTLTDSFTERCCELAKRYRLTSREAEVFALLAQGRTRSYIQDALTLSASTVKTHVAHIYGKLDVHDRQGMMDLVLAAGDPTDE